MSGIWESLLPCWSHDLAVSSKGSQLVLLWGLHFLTQTPPAIASVPVDQYLHILKIIVIIFAAPETEPRTLPTLGKCSAIELQPQPLCFQVLTT